MTPETQRMVRNVAYSMWRRLPPGHDPKDIEQEALLGALKAPHGCQARAAKFAIIEYLRREYPGSRSGRPCRYQQIDGEWVVSANQERRVISAEERAAVLAAVDQLPVDQLEVVRLVFFDGLSQVEAARRLNRSVSFVQKRQYRAMESLRLSIAEVLYA